MKENEPREKKGDAKERGAKENRQREIRKLDRLIKDNEKMANVIHENTSIV